MTILILSLSNEHLRRRQPVEDGYAPHCPMLVSVPDNCPARYVPCSKDKRVGSLVTMRAAIISDIHGNAHALEQVMADAMSFGPIDEIWCVGDIVGYGPDPGACVSELVDASYLGTRVIAIAGNHDRAATGGLSTVGFNPAAKRAAQWTSNHLDARTHAWLQRLRETATAGVDGQFTIVHGSPNDPLWAYTKRPEDALDCLLSIQTLHCIVGHTHEPSLFERPENGRGERFNAELPVPIPFDVGAIVRVRSGHRYVVNPGSVGQPRDGDPRAAYVLYEWLSATEETMQLRRVHYDIEAVQARIRAEGLPDVLANRLSFGR
jgi:diadenosine tetraphosphatase ApaH/serine/threonine PP2A family protein phosphatase